MDLDSLAVCIVFLSGLPSTACRVYSGVLSRNIKEDIAAIASRRALVRNKGGRVSSAKIEAVRGHLDEYRCDEIVR